MDHPCELTTYSKLFLTLVVKRTHMRLNSLTIRVFPPQALSIFCKFYGIPCTTHIETSITHVVQ